MANSNKKGQRNVADSILGAVDKIIPGFRSFFKKGEQSKKFGSRIKQIREEINKRFGNK